MPERMQGVSKGVLQGVERVEEAVSERTPEFFKSPLGGIELWAVRWKQKRLDVVGPNDFGAAVT